MVKVHIDGQMEVNIPVLGLIAPLRVRGLIFGRITENLKEDGKQTNCMERAFIPGLMVENTMVITLMIKRVALALITGLMAECTKDIGWRENNMVRENLLTARESLE